MLSSYCRRKCCKAHEDNKNKFSTGSIFKQKGYAVKFMYGGDAFFDNMEDFSQAMAMILLIKNI
jgi:phosphoglycerol transferase MdoB-like AlkP superfamily enzyme